MPVNLNQYQASVGVFNNQNCAQCNSLFSSLPSANYKKLKRDSAEEKSLDFCQWKFLA